MRFIGNKERLVDWIYKEMISNNINGNTFFDFFSGTTNVSKYFKKKNQSIITSDLLYFSFVLQKAYIYNNSIPEFKFVLDEIKFTSEKLFSDNYSLVIEYLNTLEPIEGFIYNNYTPSGTKNLDIPRMYFTDDNGKKIDSIRQKIEFWRKKSLISESEYYILLASLIESVPFYSNILGVFAAFKKDWDQRALKPFLLRKIDLIVDNKKHYVFNQDSIKLLDKFEYDIIYLDPPYNHRQYAPNYHLLETIAKYDNPIIKGIAGIRNYDEQKSDFCNKEKAILQLEKIINSKNYKYLLLSYNNEGVIPEDIIIELMTKKGNTKIIEYDYLRFKSNNNGLSKSKKYIKEQLYILEKNIK